MIRLTVTSENLCSCGKRVAPCVSELLIKDMHSVSADADEHRRTREALLRAYDSAGCG